MALLCRKDCSVFTYKLQLWLYSDVCDYFHVLVKSVEGIFCYSYVDFISSSCLVFALVPAPSPPFLTVTRGRSQTNFVQVLDMEVVNLYHCIGTFFPYI